MESKRTMIDLPIIFLIALPLLPLILTMIPIEDIVERLIKLLL